MRLRKIKKLFTLFILICLFFNVNNIMSFATNSDNTKAIQQSANNSKTSKKQDKTDKEKDDTKKLNPFPYDEEYYNIFSSFMFSKNNLNALQKALSIYNRKLNSKVLKEKTGTTTTNANNENTNPADEDSGEVSSDSAKEEEEEIYDQIDRNVGNVYLKSIMFISKNHWTIWINDVKISNDTNNNTENEFYIKNINQDTATIVWSLFRSKWKFVNINNAISADKYVFNEEKNKIELTFTLHINQTYMASEDKIIDGKFKEETIFIDKSPDSLINIENSDTSFDDLLKGI